MTSPASWSDPGAIMVADGVHRIPLPLPDDSLKAVNVYAIEDDGGVVLIDSGWALAESRERLELGLNSLGYELGDVRRFLVTHVHRDHYTQAVVLRKEFGMRVALGIGEQPSIESFHRDGDPLASHIDQLRLCGAEPLVRDLLAQERGPLNLDEWQFPDDWLADGQLLELSGRTLEVMATPGHTRGHVVFIDRPNQLLFAGDHVLPHITPSIGVEVTSPELRPLADYISSLRLMAELPDLRLLPAHGSVTESVHIRVRELELHHARRLDESEAAIAAGSQTAYETAQALTWTRHERAFTTLDPFNQLLATTEIQAHLDVLVLRERLTSDLVDGVTVYRR